MSGLGDSIFGASPMFHQNRSIQAEGGKSLRSEARPACPTSQVKDFPSPDDEANGGIKFVDSLL